MALEGMDWGLRDETELLQAIMEGMAEGICVLEENGRILFLNAAATDMLGYVRGDVLPAPAPILHDVVAEGHILQDEETTLARKDGTVVPVAYTASPVRIAPERHQALLIFRDISRRRMAEAALTRSREQLHAIFSGAVIGIVLLELNGRIVRSNPAWQKMIGATDSQLQDQPFRDFIAPADRAAYDQQLNDLREGKVASCQLDLRCLPRAGKPSWMHLTMSPLHDAAGELRRAILMLEDVSENKAAAAELTELKRRLARSREAERVRLARELHDGPVQDLYAVRYQLQALQNHLTDPAAREQMVRLLALFQQVSDKLRTISHALRPPALAPFGLAAAIRSYVEEFQQLYPHLTVNLDLTPDEQALPEHTRLVLYRILQEMLSNVARHADATQVLVRFVLSEDEVLLEIQDNGVGFEVPGRWIELARQGHLGLVGASERAAEINGRLIILSAPRQGTIVRVLAPRDEL